MGEFEYQDEVYQPVEEADVRKVIKIDRAPGIDIITPTMLKCVNVSLITKLTEVDNESFEEGKIPVSLLVGKMTSFHRKGTIPRSK